MLQFKIDPTELFVYKYLYVILVIIKKFLTDVNFIHQNIIFLQKMLEILLIFIIIIIEK